MVVTGQAACALGRYHFETLLPRWHIFAVIGPDFLSLISYRNGIGA